MTCRHILSRLIAAGLLLAPAPAFAQALSAADLMDMPLEKLVDIEVMVTGASKYAEKVSESPSVVEVITADDIKTYGYRTLGEAINGLHGLYTSGDSNHTTVGVRGFLPTGAPNARTLIMVDGRRMNENVHDSAYVGQEFMLDMGLVDHIEFISGPGSSMYGANAMLGVVNVVTKKGSDINGSQVAISGGTFDTRTARATFGKKLSDGTDVLLSASRYLSDGESNIYYPEFDSPATNNGIAHDMDKENAEHFFAKARLQDVTLTAGYVSRFKRIPTGYYDTDFNDQRFGNTDTHGYGEIKYNKSLNDQTQIELTGFAHAYDSSGDYPYFTTAGYLETDSYSGRWSGAEATLVTTALDKHKIVVGGEFQYDARQQLQAVTDTGIYFQNSDRSGFRSGIYAQDNINLRDDLILSAGLRLDQHHMIKKMQINPRLGLIWDPRQDINVKLLYGSAFRAPNSFERDYDDGLNWAANPNNKQERIRNYEGVIEWKSNDGLRLTGSLFYNQFKRVLIADDQDPSSPTYLQYLNSGDLASAGGEIGVVKEWDGGRSFKLSYNHTEYRHYKGSPWGTEKDAPRDVAKIRYAEPLFDGAAKLGVESVFVGRRQTYLYHIEDSYNYVNANLTSQNIIPGVDVSFGVYNIFDTDVNMIGGVYVQQDVLTMHGRNALLTISKTF